MAEQPAGKRGPATTPTTLNDLPNNVLIRILTFLPLISAIKTSLISRKWRNLWHFIPSLTFKITKFPGNPDIPLSLNVRHFSDFISLTLLNRPNTFPLNKFSLLFLYSYNHGYRSLVTTWLRYALDCQVVKLILSFAVETIKRDEHIDDDGSENSPHYGFHFSDLRYTTSVRCLRLCCCELIMPSNKLLRFESLRRLELVDIDIADEVLSDLISRCENLKKLVLSRFQGLRKFRVVSEKLKALELSFYTVENFADFDSSVEICAPNLSKIKMNNFYVENYKGDLSSVVDAELEFRRREGYAVHCWSSSMRWLAGVLRLTVQNNLFMIKYNESFQFKNLKHLEIKTGYSHNEMVGLAALLRRSPLLETLVLDYVYQTDEEASFYDDIKAMPFTFDIPSLQEVKMINFRNTDIEYYVLVLFVSENVVLDKVVLVPARLENTSLTGTIVLDWTGCEDWNSVVAALLRHYLVPEK